FRFGRRRHHLFLCIAVARRAGRRRRGRALPSDRAAHRAAAPELQVLTAAAGTPPCSCDNASDAPASRGRTGASLGPNDEKHRMTQPKPIESYLMDMDGVIVRENQLVPGAD